MMSTVAVRASAESVRPTEGTVQIKTKAVSVAARMPDQDGDHWRVSEAETPAADLPVGPERSSALIRGRCSR